MFYLPLAQCSRSKAEICSAVDSQIARYLMPLSNQRLNEQG